MNQTVVFLWLACVVVFALIEASCPCLLSIWFAAGALGAMVCAIAGADFWLQLVVFVVISGGMLAALRPWLRKYITPRIIPTNADSLIGQEAVVIEPIDNIQSQGRAKIRGMEWSARSIDDKPIAAGTVVYVRRIEGVKLMVEPVQVPAEPVK